MLFADIAVNTHIYDQLTYEVPEHLSAEDPLAEGSLVIVSVRGRKLAGFVIAIHSKKPDFKALPILRVVESFTPLSKRYLAFISWVADFYFYPLGEALFLTLPKAFKQTKILDNKWQEKTRPKQEAFYRLADTPKNAQNIALTPAQLRSLALFEEAQQKNQSCLSRKSIIQSVGSTRAVNALVKKGLVEELNYEDLPKSSIEDSHDKDSNEIESDNKALVPTHEAVRIDNLLKEETLKLSQEQSLALKRLSSERSLSGLSSPYILYGVTGSGKTEVYMQLAALHLSRARQVLVLIPEINLSFQTVERFEKRFNAAIHVLHSGVSHKKREDSWLAARSGQAQIVIGTRMSILAPFKNLGLIIVDEEHDTSYDQDSFLRYSARDVALALALRDKIQIVLGSATPRLGSFRYGEAANKQAEQRKSAQNQTTKQAQGYSLLYLQHRPESTALPKIHAEDIRGETLHGGLSEKSLKRIHENVSCGNQSLVFINRRGFAETMICQLCGHQSRCSRCDQTLTVHMQPPSLQCHHCGIRQALVQRCAACRSHQVNAVGIGTEQVELALKNHDPDCPIIRVDSDTMKSLKNLKQTIARIKSGEPCIIVGTQMLAKGHHFPSLNQAIVLNTDQGILSAHPETVEQTVQTLFQLSGRVGRERNQEGHVYIQSIDATNEWYSMLSQHDYQRVSQRLLAIASHSFMPPFARSITFFARGNDPNICINALRTLHLFLDNKAKAELIISPIIPSRLTRIGNEYFYEQSYRGAHKQFTHHALKHAFSLLQEDSTQTAASSRRSIFSVRVQ